LLGRKNEGKIYNKDMALYRKYRPQTFEEVVGQSHVTEILTKALDNQKISHAYLFAGPKGSGKTSCARIFAKGLNCETGITSKPCNECESCKLINEGHSLDVIEIDAASNRGVDEIRELRERVKYRPAQSRYKVYIIDEAHMLTREAFNALLKTLEEPPEYVVFILATTDPQKIPPTVLSRCQRFRFKKLTSDEVFQILENVCKSEGFSYQREALELIAEVSDGAVRDALNLLEQISVVDEGKVSIKTARFLLNVVEDEVILDLLKTAFEDMDEAVERLAALMESGVEPMELFRTMKSLVRRSVFKNKPWPRDEALEMFKVLESYNFIMERTEFPAVALVALLNELRSKANLGTPKGGESAPLPQKNAGKQKTAVAEKPQEPAAETKKERKDSNQKREELVDNVEAEAVKEATESESKTEVSDAVATSVTAVGEEESSQDATDLQSWIENVRSEYFPLYVVLREGKARIEGDRLILSFPGLLHMYRRFMELPQVQKVLHNYGHFKVELQTEVEEKDESVLELFKQVFPEAQIEEVKSN